MPDHVHLLVEVDPQFGIHRLVKQIKGYSSRILRQEFPWLRSRIPTLWTNSYFVSTVGGSPLEAIKKYIENQYERRKGRLSNKRSPNNMNILGIGTIMTDIYLRVPQFANLGSQEVINFFERKVGGSVVNTTLILNQLELNPTLIASVGKDIEGSKACAYLKNQNINLIPSPSEITASVYILSDGQENIMYNHSPFSQIILPEIETPDVFYTSCYELHNINAFKDILDACDKTYLDLSPTLKQIPIQVLEECLSSFSVITGNVKEFRLLFELTQSSSVQDLICRYGFKKAYIKQGCFGSSVFTNNNFYSAPVPPATNTIGCGDAYNAGIIYGEINNYDLQSTINLGNHLGRNAAQFGFNPQLVTLGFPKAM